MTTTTTLEHATSPYHEPTGPYPVSWGAWLSIFGAGVVQSADVLLAKNTLDVVARAQGWVSWLIALALALASVFLAFAAGKEHRRGRRASRWTYVAAWFFLGLGMATLRVLRPLLEGEELNNGEMLLAGFIFVLYLGAGLKIMGTSRDLYNPKRTQLAAAQRAERRTARKLVALEGKFSRVSEALSQSALRRGALEAERDALVAEAAAGASELKNRARHEIAARVGREDATGLYRDPHWPDDEAPAA